MRVTRGGRSRDPRGLRSALTAPASRCRTLSVRRRRRALARHSSCSQSIAVAYRSTARREASGPRRGWRSPAPAPARAARAARAAPAAAAPGGRRAPRTRPPAPAARAPTAPTRLRLSVERPNRCYVHRTLVKRRGAAFLGLCGRAVCSLTFNECPSPPSARGSPIVILDRSECSKAEQFHRINGKAYKRVVFNLLTDELIRG